MFRRLLIAAAVVGVAVTVVTALFPLSIDEAFWLGVTRRVADGGTLYVDAIDNKSPLVFLTVGLLDALPGSFQLARALVVGSATTAIVLLAGNLARSLPVAVLAGTLAGFLSVFALSTELLAIVLVLTAILLWQADRPGWSALVALIAVGFDPRAIALAVLIPVALAGDRAVKGRFLATFGLGALGVAAIILSVDDLRYALVELNLGSRQAGSWDPQSQLVVALGALLPMVTALALWGRTGSWALFVAGVAVALLSLQDFEHYWLLAIPGLVLAVAGTPTARQALVVALASIPLVVNVVGWQEFRADAEATYERVAEVLADNLDDDGRWAQFDLQPYVWVTEQGSSATRSPGIGYLTWDSSRREGHLRELADRDDIEAIVDDGGLQVSREQVREGGRELWDVLRPKLDVLTCRQEVGSITVHLPQPACAP